MKKVITYGTFDLFLAEENKSSYEEIDKAIDVLMP